MCQINEQHLLEKAQPRFLIGENEEDFCSLVFSISSIPKKFEGIELNFHEIF